MKKPACLPLAQPLSAFVASLLMLAGPSAHAQENAASLHPDPFQIVDITPPDGVLLEVGGLALLPDGTLGIATRRGEIFVVSNPTSNQPQFQLFAFGLHEILGLAYKDGAFYAAQRGELTRITDTDGDGRGDLFETVGAWPLSGNYHEYSYGPKIAPDGSLFVTTNVGFANPEWFRGVSLVPWRGWALRFTPDGQMEPWATGMRSPAGLEVIDGEFFYTDNQGDWIGSGGLWHLPKGTFAGHPAGLAWSGLANPPIDVTPEDVYEQVDPRNAKNADGHPIKPENIPDEADFKTLADLTGVFPEIRMPAVWLPHGILGVSNADVIEIPKNAFGPFGGQVLVGDQGQSKIVRVFLEKVDGEYQGAAFDFLDGFKSGVFRLAFAKDRSLFVGMTSRGWSSVGPEMQGLQRVVYGGDKPFTMKAVRAMPDGFEIEFTKPVDRERAEDLASFAIQSFTYKFHPVYGSPPVNMSEHAIRGVRVSEDGYKARLLVENLRRHFVHQIVLQNIRSAEGQPLRHAAAYYTLHNIPSGRHLAMSEVSTRNSRPAEEAPAAVIDTSNFSQVQPLLAKNTCTACHAPDRRQVGPAFMEIAQREYSVDKIVQLIRQPENRNWPGFSTPMPPMPHVPEHEARAIAAWITSLKK